MKGPTYTYIVAAVLTFIATSDVVTVSFVPPTTIGYALEAIAVGVLVALVHSIHVAHYRAQTVLEIRKPD